MPFKAASPPPPLPPRPPHSSQLWQPQSTQRHTPLREAEARVKPTLADPQTDISRHHRCEAEPEERILHLWVPAHPASRPAGLGVKAGIPRGRGASCFPPLGLCFSVRLRASAPASQVPSQVNGSYRKKSGRPNQISNSCKLRSSAQCPQTSPRTEGRRMEPCRPRRQPPATPRPARQPEPSCAGRVYPKQVKEASYPEKAVKFSSCNFCYDYKQGGNCPIYWVKHINY